MARVLVIDDEEQVRDVLKRVLQKLGHEVELAEDGIQGLQRYQENPADLVISDVFMPGKDGLDTMIELRKEDPEAKILLISGNWQRLCVEASHLCEHLGAIGVLEKPFDIKTVYKMIETALAITH